MQKPFQNTLGKIHQDTRILYYSYAQRCEQHRPPKPLLRNPMQLRSYLRQAISPIVTVIYGIELLFVLHLSSQPNTVKSIDQVLRKICRALKNQTDHIGIEIDQENLLKDIPTDCIHVHSNVPSLCIEKSIMNILHHIRRSQTNTESIYPLRYTREPCRTLFYSVVTPNFYMGPFLYRHI